jgi:hypothetical protein
MIGRAVPIPKTPAKCLRGSNLAIDMKESLRRGKGLLCIPHVHEKCNAKAGVEAGAKARAGSEPEKGGGHEGGLWRERRGHDCVLITLIWRRGPFTPREKGGEGGGMERRVCVCVCVCVCGGGGGGFGGGGGGVYTEWGSLACYAI